MAEADNKPTVFISYSHKDAAEKDKVLTFLGALKHDCEIDLWVDTRLDDAVDGLRNAGQQDHIPRGLLARAEYRRFNGDFVDARIDLDEAYKIAARGGMRLFECDAHIEACRLLLAMAEARETDALDDLPPDSLLKLYLAPLECGGSPPLSPVTADAPAASQTFPATARGESGPSVGSGDAAGVAGVAASEETCGPDESGGKPPHSKETPPRTDGAGLAGPGAFLPAVLVAAARGHLEKAASMVEETGYHRRDPEILLETAHVRLVEHDLAAHAAHTATDALLDAARESLDAAKARIEEMGCRRWLIDWERFNTTLRAP